MKATGAVRGHNDRVPSTSFRRTMRNSSSAGTTSRSKQCVCAHSAAMLLAWASASAAAEPDDGGPPAAARGEGIEWKLTGTSLHETQRRSAIDLNLRGKTGPNTFWLGHYQRGTDFLQSRAGYEREERIPIGKVIGSAQVATRGFIGGTLTAELGTGRAYAIAGIGRTNLKPYYNLNFDPNDAVTVGAGWRAGKDSALTLLNIRDDRLGTGQRVTHFIYRTRPTRDTRWTFDLFHKNGYASVAGVSGERASFKGTGFALAYDFEPYFVRIAWDPKVNFTGSDMLRLAGGLRF